MDNKLTLKTHVLFRLFSGDQFFKMAPYIICGVMVLLYVLTVTVDVYKYKRYHCLRSHAHRV